MADMKRPVPGAGRRALLAARTSRSGCLAIACCLAAPAWPQSTTATEPGATGSRPRERDPASIFLLRQFDVAGGFAEQAARIPLAVPPMGAFLALQLPVAAAARELDLFIADAGINRILRFDGTRQSMGPVADFAARPGTRLLAQPDGSLTVLDPGTGSLLRLTRTGALLARISNESLLAGVVDLALDESTGTLWLADQAQSRVVQMRPGLEATIALQPTTADGTAVGRLNALAMAAGRLYVIDASSRQVREIARDGRVLASYGQDELKLPRGIAVDRHQRVFVADGFDQTLHVFRDGLHVARIGAAALGAIELREVRIHGDTMSVVDGIGRRVLVFRVRVPVMRQ